MFGGLAFLVRGYMTVGVGQDELMVRFDKDKYQEYLKLPGAREMDFTGRPMKGFVFVDPAALSEDQDLKTWIQKSLDYVTTLPDKKIQT